MMDKEMYRKVTRALQESWDKNTSSVSDEWSGNNPSRGQCVPSSLVVQDYFGGDLKRVHALGGTVDETHYFNRLDDGTVIDITASQYASLAPVVFTEKPVDLGAAQCRTTREYVLKNQRTFARYVLLKARVINLLEITE